jgi:SAM-dependent methyltransferase
MKRAYGSNTYWIERYAKRQATDDETSEWLIAAAQLGPLLSEMLPRDAAVLDVGCGNSPLVFDLLRDSIHGENSRALAVDIAPVAIQDMTDEQRARIRRGEASARRVALLCADLTQPPAGWLEENRSAYDASIDKSTTDGMLCDTRRGAQRVRALYGVVGAVLRPAAKAVIVSWRAPEDGLAWLLDVVLGGLRSAETPHSEVFSWSLDIHSLCVDDEEASADAHANAPPPPHVYLLSRRPRRVSRRIAAARNVRVATAAAAAAADNTPDEQPTLTVRQHWHTV